MERNGTKWNEIELYAMKWNETKWNGTDGSMWSEMEQNEIKLNQMTWNDMKQHETTNMTWHETECSEMKWRELKKPRLFSVSGYRWLVWKTLDQMWRWDEIKLSELLLYDTLLSSSRLFAFDELHVSSRPNFCIMGLLFASASYTTSDVSWRMLHNLLRRLIHIPQKPRWTSPLCADAPVVLRAIPVGAYVNHSTPMQTPLRVSHHHLPKQC